ncbi:thioesterase family protein [Amycolatopsis sp. NPDC051373]|uniref:thioesterase family protein n=1 Tax=Amycolatopsis sp. NPDC051373 TaxID=3155801 RepID=UPI00344E0414
MSTTTFAAVSAVKRRSPGGFDADISPQWTIGGKPNGGYLLSLLARAAVVEREHSDVLAASAHYLRSPDPGPAEVEIETLRTGRGSSQVRGRLVQNGKTAVEALFTVGTLTEGEVYWQDGRPDPRPDIESTFRVPGTTPLGLPVAIMDEIEVRLDPDSARVFTDGPSGRGELLGRLALPGGEPFDPISLLFAVDAFPPATFDISASGWVPTLELTAYVRARPAPGPLRVLHRAHLITDGRVDESCHVWDSTGTLVAQGTQLAGIRLG